MIYDTLIAELEDMRESLAAFLIDCGVTPSHTLRGMLQDLENVVAIRKSKNYLAVGVNRQGYIKKLTKIDGILEHKPLPEDVLRGYYKYEKGKVVLDERMKLERR